MAVDSLEPDEYTLHGFFSPDLPPVLTVESGDTVRLRTLDAEWALEPFTTFTPGRPPPARRATTRIEGSKGHALCGPIALRGTLPDMTIATPEDTSMAIRRWSTTPHVRELLKKTEANTGVSSVERITHVTPDRSIQETSR
jgi:hypothetical protein